jgi:integrase
MKKPKPQKTEFHSIYGSVHVYVRRHINGCELRDPNETRCSCPKWLYSKPRGAKAVQRAAGTPSFTEACAEAQRILKGFDPEIAMAREKNEPVPGIAIEAAIGLYKTSLRERSANYIRNCMMPLKRRKPREYENGRALNLSLLDWLDRTNAAAREPVLRVEQLTSDHLDQWAATWRSNDQTTHIWRGNVETFLKWCGLHDHLVKQPVFRERHCVRGGNRCGYFADAEIATLRAALPFYRMDGRSLPENYAARLGAFIDLGRWGGLSLVDIVHFSPRINLTANGVLTYRRHKNGQVATVALDPTVAGRLRSIPLEEGCDPERPFRSRGTLNRDCRVWRDRFQALCKFAGIPEVEIENGTRIPAHPHCLRDSFAVSAITHGVAIENVARALGHATVGTTQKHYLFWMKQREDFCVADQRAGLARHAREEAEAREAAEPTSDGQQVVQ